MGWDKPTGEKKPGIPSEGTGEEPDIYEQRKDLAEREQFEREAAEEALATEGHGSSKVALDRLNKETKEGTLYMTARDRKINEVRDMTGETKDVRPMGRLITKDVGPMGRLITEMENLCAQGADLSSKAERINKRILGTTTESLMSVEPITEDAREPSFTERMQDLMNTMQGHIASVKHDIEQLEDSL